jgi:hypothetical protein
MNHGAMTRIKILEFHGNGSIVDTAGLKHQAREAPSTKPFKRQARATNCRASICLIDRSSKRQATSSKRHEPRFSLESF